ncbi:hypothetical protein FHS04_000319 [Mesoflavibacter sabulilitoris]|uniref:Uncharacterized protein n=1 Tax=Mesoflavibacter zeaxanthinifaciens subsp. sabulilitoris TaxID=1520893 RepID=A0A2T1NGT9_9FLAO|nr:hypothetical protein [Mesoflavibacter zeaxanthinifaciens]MBB3122831.1 hypothetical protein [Mesoflavibacter zeaxanthinifaciens subsp. sabulilitoris]PSG92088.1 hypothetical protein C7H61_05785 [Mesoflavibacter zeaxanthinifaciens subsp. sabulilitoris]
METTKIETTKQSVTKYSIQDYMSIGYLFLLVLGVANQAIFYGLLGVNIFEYTSVLDVLLSPLAVISSHWLMPVILAVLIPLMIGYFKLLQWYYVKLSRKEKYQSGKKKEKLDKVLKSLNKKYAVIPFILMMLICMFLGFGLGGGYKSKEKLETQKYNYTHQIVYEDGEAKDVKILGKNSLYVFYATQDNKDVQISPIEGNIKVIKKLPSKDKKELIEN